MLRKLEPDRLSTQIVIALLEFHYGAPFLYD